MARSFVAASSQSIYRTATPPVTTYPFTFSAWIKFQHNTQQAVCGVVDKDSASNYSLLRTGMTTVVCESRNTASGVIYSGSVAYPNNEWCHVVGVFPSATSRSCYVNGTKSTGDDTTSVTISTAYDRFAIGALMRSTPAYYANGYIAEVAAWNVQLVQSEIDVLVAGYSPLFVRPGSLQAYFPLYGRDVPNGIEENWGTWSNNVSGVNSPGTVDHPPRIIYPRRRTIVLPALATPTGTTPEDDLSTVAGGPVAWGPVAGSYYAPGSGVTGTFAATEATDTASAGGVVLVAGSSSVTDAADTAAASGVVRVAGSTALTEASADTLAASGAAAVRGPLAVTEAAVDALSGTAKALVTGTTALTEAGVDAFSATGYQVGDNRLAATDSPDTAAASGKVRVAGSLSKTETYDVSGISAAVLVRGSTAATEQGTEVYAAAGHVAIAGVLGLGEVGNDSIISVGAVRVTGALSRTESSDTMFVYGSSTGMPYLSAATIVDLLDTTARPRVTVTF